MVKPLIGRWIKGIVGILISAFFLYLALRGTDWGTVLNYVMAVPLKSLFYSFLVLIIHFLIRSYRWQYITRSAGRITFYDSFLAVMLGYFFNMIFPFRLGELVKISVTARKNRRITFSSGLGFLIVERGMDLLSLLLIFVAILPYVHITDRIKGKLLTLLYVLLVLFTVMIAAARWIKLPSEETTGLKGKFFAFIKGLKVLGGVDRLMTVLLLSLALWPWSALYYHFLLEGTGIHLSLIVAILLPIVVGMGVALPSAPGFIGTYEYFVILVLGFYEIKHDQAVASALVIHFWQYIIIIVIGGILLIKEGTIDINKLRKE